MVFGTVISLTKLGMHKHALSKDIDCSLTRPIHQFVPVYTLMPQREIGLG